MTPLFSTSTGCLIIDLFWNTGEIRALVLLCIQSTKMKESLQESVWAPYLSDMRRGDVLRAAAVIHNKQCRNSRNTLSLTWCGMGWAPASAPLQTGLGCASGAPPWPPSLPTLQALVQQSRRWAGKPLSGWGGNGRAGAVEDPCFLGFVIMSSIPQLNIQCLVGPSGEDTYKNWPWKTGKALRRDGNAKAVGFPDASQCRTEEGASILQWKRWEPQNAS